MTAYKPGDPTTINRLYGRSKGKPLRAGQQDLIDTLLPQIAVPTEGEVTAEALFGYDRPLHFEIGFGYLLHPDPWPKARHAKRRMMNDGPLDLIAAKLKPGGEFRFGTDHPIYLQHALMVMRRHRHQFEWLAQDSQDFQVRPGGWPETRYEAKARAHGHEVWYFRYRRTDAK